MALKHRREKKRTKAKQLHLMEKKGGGPETKEEKGNTEGGKNKFPFPLKGQADLKKKPMFSPSMANIDVSKTSQSEVMSFHNRLNINLAVEFESVLNRI